MYAVPSAALIVAIVTVLLNSYSSNATVSIISSTFAVASAAVTTKSESVVVPAGSVTFASYTLTLVSLNSAFAIIASVSLCCFEGQIRKPMYAKPIYKLDMA